MRISKRQLRKIIRESIVVEHNSLLQENRFRRAWDWVRQKGKVGWASTREFFKNLKTELQETGHGIRILSKLASRQPLEPNEMAELKQQMKDVAKGIPLLALVALPGGGIATVALVKIANRVGVDLVPSSFKPGEDPQPHEKIGYSKWRER